MSSVVTVGSELSHAVLSRDSKYRYLLTRDLSEVQQRMPGEEVKSTNQTCLFIMLNPSTADAHADDPTIRKCMKFARRWGYRYLRVVNLFALRSTDPRYLQTDPSPVGPGNDEWICNYAAAADLVVCAWGNWGAIRRRSDFVRRQLKGQTLHCLAINANGEPKHPLYVRDDADPIRYND